MLRRSVDLLLLAALISAAFVYREPLFALAQQLYARALPCTQPIRYALGDFDERFGLSREELLASIREAEKIWEEPIGRDLFEHGEDGVLTVSLAYDERQATTETLRDLGFEVNESRASYDAVKERYDDMKASYAQKKATFEEAVRAYDKRQAAYTSQVRMWNARGGAPEAEYEKLQREKEVLRREGKELESMQASLNNVADELNALVGTLNSLATKLHLNVEKYNTVGRAVGAEFEEGSYEESPGRLAIEIYEFSSRAKLVRVLAHELGHALGLEHIGDESAIMYRLNQGEAVVASAGDVAELERHCSIQ